MSRKWENIGRRYEPFEYDPNSKQTYFEFLKVGYPGKEPVAKSGEASNAPPTTFGKSSLDWDWSDN